MMIIASMMIIATTRLLIVVGVIFALVMFSKHLGVRGTLSLLGLVVLVPIVLYSGTTTQMEQQIPEQVANEMAALARVEISTHKMWEELNRPRIDLIEETAIPKDSDTKHKKEEQKEAIAKRPKWVGVTHHRVGNVLRKVVVSDPYTDVEQCYQALQDGPMREIMNARLNELFPGCYYPTLERLGLGPDFFWREVCPEPEWIETRESSVGEMKRVHVLMEFDDSVNKALKLAYRKYERRFRIQEVGGFAGIVLGGVALLFGMLKIDTMTKGYYTKRLFFGVPAVIIAVIMLIN